MKLIFYLVLYFYFQFIRAKEKSNATNDCINGDYTIFVKESMY